MTQASTQSVAPSRTAAGTNPKPAQDADAAVTQELRRIRSAHPGAVCCIVIGKAQSKIKSKKAGTHYLAISGEGGQMTVEMNEQDATAIVIGKHYAFDAPVTFGMFGGKPEFRTATVLYEL